MKLVLAIGITQVILTTGFNIFNACRFFLPDATQKDPNSYWMLNARFSQYLSIFFIDMFMIVTMMLLLVLMRQVELQVLVSLGIYKNVENMTDREMIAEYEKLKKQSRKMQRRLRKQKKTSKATQHLSYNSNDSASDADYSQNDDSGSIKEQRLKLAGIGRDSMASE